MNSTIQESLYMTALTLNSHNQRLQRCTTCTCMFWFNLGFGSIYVFHRLSFVSDYGIYDDKTKESKNQSKNN